MNRDLFIKSLGYIGVPIALYNLFYFKGDLNFLWLVFLTISIAFSFGAEFILKRSNKFGFAALSLIITSIIYCLYPNIFVDDTGFVIRYFRQASKGCFYCYNESEGAVYGISSFLYGFVGSIMALPNVLKAETIILFLNFSGLFVTLLMLFKISHHFLKDFFLTTLMTLLVIVSSSKFLAVTTVGLETNFHLAIVFTTIWFFITNNVKWMLLFMALSVISKLDTVPLMLVLAGIHLYDTHALYFGKNSLKAWTTIGIWAVLPIIIFVGLTFILFEGPLPQSAYAKLYFHGHPSDHWFPFGELMYDKGERMALMKILVLFISLHISLALYLKRFRLNDFAFGLGFLATLVLFYIYNPAERMLWYYAMPELLAFMQLVISASFIISGIKSHIKLKQIILFSALFIAAFPLTSKEKAWLDQSIKTVEVERELIGRYIAQNLSSSDTIIASHGYFGAYTDAYVLDLSGLNCKLATDYKRNLDSVLTDFRPGYYIHHGDRYQLDMANKHGYELDTVCYNINLYGYPSWTLFKRTDHNNHVSRLAQANIKADEVESEKLIIAKGSSITLDIGNANSIWFGISNEDKAEQREVLIQHGSKSEKLTLPAHQTTQNEPHLTIKTIHLSLERGTEKVVIKCKGPVRIHDPIIEKKD